MHLSGGSNLSGWVFDERNGIMQPIKYLSRSLVFAFALVLNSSLLLADAPIQIQINVQGGTVFPENNTLSGEIQWVAAHDFVMDPGIYIFSVNFQYNNSDNIPSSPMISDLSLIEWPVEFDDAIPWTFTQISSTLDGPLDIWLWETMLAIDSEDISPTFQAGQVIATSNWSTGGDDLDDIEDNSGFKIYANCSKWVWISQYIPGTDIKGFWGTSFSDSEELVFNPEPIPESTTSSLLVFSGLGILCSKRRTA